jgi:hypothetical protein
MHLSLHVELRTPRSLGTLLKLPISHCPMKHYAGGNGESAILRPAGAIVSLVNLLLTVEVHRLLFFVWAN